MKNQDLSKELPETVRELRLDKMLIKITKSEKGGIGFILKNIDNPHNHHTFVIKENNISLHQTKETDGIQPNLHKYIDYESFISLLGRILQDVFSTSKEISVNDPCYAEKKVQVITEHQLVIETKTRKKVVFDQDIEGYEANFEDIDLSKNGMGIILDENETMIFIQNNKIFVINFNAIEEKQKELDRLFSPIV